MSRLAVTNEACAVLAEFNRAMRARDVDGIRLYADECAYDDHRRISGASIRGRDALQAALHARGVAAEVYYPVPMPSQKVFAVLGHRAGEFPRTEQACREVLSIPTHSELTDADVRAVIDATRAALGEVERRG